MLVCRHRRAQIASVLAFVGVAGLVAGSAIVTKEAVHRSNLAPLAAVNAPARVETVAAIVPEDVRTIVPTGEARDIRDPLVAAEPMAPVAEPEVVIEEEPVTYADSPEIRYFNGRPVRPARVLTMTVTAYSPDHRSCGDSADGITSSIHSVWTNAMKLVAADSRVLPLGSMVSVPGYDSGNIVPVLDRGGAIKGNRLDVLYPTHEVALKWGVQKLRVTVWEYADGSGPCDFRAIRDSRK